MSLNVIDIRVATDYTAFTNTVEFTLAVPVSSDDAKTIYTDLVKGDWATVQGDITKAVTSSAPTPIQTLVASLLKAYSGADPSPAPSDTTDTTDTTNSTDPASGGTT